MRLGVIKGWSLADHPWQKARVPMPSQGLASVGWRNYAVYGLFYFQINALTSTPLFSFAFAVFHLVLKPASCLILELFFRQQQARYEKP